MQYIIFTSLYPYPKLVATANLWNKQQFSLTAKIYSNIEFSRLKQEKKCPFGFARRQYSDNLENAKKNPLLWQAFCYSNRLSYYNKFYFEQRDLCLLQKNLKYSQQKHKIKPSMLNPNLTHVAIFLEWLILAK